MRPISLTLENVRTFEHLEFEFPTGCAALVGANGSGKSSLVSAIDAGLFGAEGRSLADWLSKDRPEATMQIVLEFAHGETTYRVRRTFDGRGRGKSAVDFEQYQFVPDWKVGDPQYLQWLPLSRESAAATQEAIERIIGLDRASFRASAFMAQGDSGAFCESTPGRRKEILASVLGLEIWDGYRERARVDLRAAEQALAVVRARISAAETELVERASMVARLAMETEREQVARAALGECGSQLTKARERLSALREAAGLREAAERARDAAERAHASLLERIAGLEQQIREAEGRLAEREGLEVLAEGLPGLERERDAMTQHAQDWAERERLEAERARLSAEADRLSVQADTLREKAVLALDGIGSAHCDRCGSVLGEDAAKRAAQSYQTEADALMGNHQEALVACYPIEARLTQLPVLALDPDRAAHVHDLIQLGQNAQAKLAALAEVEASKTLAAADLSKVRAELPEREAALSEARAELEALGPQDPNAESDAQAGVNALEIQEHTQRASLDITLQEIARLDERLARLDKLATETEEAGSQGQSLGQEVELLSYLERACGPNGVPALILETSAIPQLEAEWNRVLRLLPTESGDIFEVELHTQRERKTGEGAVDALDIVVYANGHARPYASYSGGERARIDIAQRRALSALLTHRKGAECPLMILDEPNSLDDQGMAALAQVLEDLAAAEGLTILVVSHDPALRDAFENSITIAKVDGRSRIVGATEPAPIMEVA